MDPALHRLSVALEGKLAELERWDERAQAAFRRWFGTTEAAPRATLARRIRHMRQLVATYDDSNLRRTDGAEPFVFAHDDRVVYVGREGSPLSAATLAHELSHYTSVGATKDHVYGERAALALARLYPNKAVENADNFAFWLVAYQPNRLAAFGSEEESCRTHLHRST